MQLHHTHPTSAQRSEGTARGGQDCAAEAGKERMSDKRETRHTHSLTNAQLHANGGSGGRSALSGSHVTRDRGRTRVHWSLSSTSTLRKLTVRAKGRKMHTKLLAIIFLHTILAFHI
jgi:hypothetical protein